MNAAANGETFIITCHYHSVLSLTVMLSSVYVYYCSYVYGCLCVRVHLVIRVNL